jgi:raffinose/stachyose/melibiose transport system permease protein
MAIPDAIQMQKNPGVSSNSGRNKHNFSRIIGPWLFLVPVLILSFVVIIGPSLSTVYFSLTEWSGFNKPVFVGLKNFIDLGSDPLFKISIVNNLKWMIYSITVPMLMGLLGAWFVSTVKNRTIQMLYRIFYFMPYVLASVVVAGMFLNLFNPLSGMTAILSSIPHLAWTGKISFLGDPNLLMWSVAFIGGWQSWGFNQVVLLTAMQSIDPELFEMAELEGANRLQKLIFITIPSILPTFLYLFLLAAMFSLQVFDYVYLMIFMGGPGNSAYNLATLTYANVFRNFKTGYGIAISVTSVLFGFVFIIIYILLNKRSMED